MSSPAQSRLSALLSHFLPSSASPTAADNNKPTFEQNLNHHALSPTAFLPRAAEIEPDAIAIYHETLGGQTIRRTYRDFAERSKNFAYYLKKKGYRRVGILNTNTPSNATQIGINYRLKPSDLTYIFTHAQADFLLVDAEFLPLLSDYRSHHPHVPILVDTDVGATPSTGNPSPYELALLEGAAYDTSLGSKGWTGLSLSPKDETETFALAYTSGTTARPKGVEYTHRGVYLACLANVIESGLNPSAGIERARYLWTLPLFHAMGWTFPFAVTAVRGTHYCLRKIDYPTIWRLLREEGITHFNAAPTVCTLLCADPAATKLAEPGVRVTVAASPPTATLFARMEKLDLRPVHVYGLTETYGPITRGYILPEWEALPTQEKYDKMARQGFGFVTSMAVRVVKPEHLDSTTGSVVDVKKDGKEVGEIVFTGNICAKGYYRDSEATRKLWEGGVNHSGDLAVWEPDGSVKIIDRGKDIIISGGENISSLSVESVLIQHPSILEVAIVAISDEKFGERPKAYVTLSTSTAANETAAAAATETEILAWAKAHPQMSGFMMPKEVEIVKELPKTSTGKVRKNVLREWAKGAKRDGEDGA